MLPWLRQRQARRWRSIASGGTYPATFASSVAWQPSRSWIFPSDEIKPCTAIQREVAAVVKDVQPKGDDDVPVA
jgi:hypothetical protein